MARVDPNNRSRLWTDPDVEGVLMMHADFTTHEFAPHSHEEIVIALTERGGSEFRSRGVYDQAEPGAVLVFNPGEPHSGRMARNHRWRYRAFYLTPESTRRFAGQVGLPEQAVPRFLSNKLHDRRLFDRLAQVHMWSEQPGSRLQKQSGLLEVLAELFQRHGDPAPEPGPLGGEESGIRRALDYLNDHYADNVSLADLSRLVNIGTYHLIRCFNKELGLSPHAYLTQIRVRRARDLLEAGVPAAEAAVQVGLYDQSALNRHFKRIHGVTPGQYLAAIRPDVQT